MLTLVLFAFLAQLFKAFGGLFDSFTGPGVLFACWELGRKILFAIFLGALSDVKQTWSLIVLDSVTTALVIWKRPFIDRVVNAKTGFLMLQQLLTLVIPLFVAYNVIGCGCVQCTGAACH